MLQLTLQSGGLYHLFLSAVSSLGLHGGATFWLPFLEITGEQAIPMELSLGSYSG